MGQQAVWKTYESMLVELKKNNVTLPENVLGDLRAAKTMIILQNTKDTHCDNYTKIDEYFANLESFIITQADAKLGSKQVDLWLKQISIARAALDECECEMAESELTKEIKFITGVPKDEKWVRVEPTDTMPYEKVKELAKANNLTLKKQSDGKIVVHGAPDSIKQFMKQMTAKATKLKK